MSVATETNPRALTAGQLAVYVLVGVFFGIVLVKSEVVSWFRIQEMFRFQSFHMYGIIGSAVVVSAITMQVAKRFKGRALTGEAVCLEEKSLKTPYRYWIGGTLFGFGWALTGACPGPIFALVGYGITVFIPVLLSAIVGAWAYGVLAPRLPH